MALMALRQLKAVIITSVSVYKMDDNPTLRF